MKKENENKSKCPEYLKDTDDGIIGKSFGQEFATVSEGPKK